MPDELAWLGLAASAPFGVIGYGLSVVGRLRIHRDPDGQYRGPWAAWVEFYGGLALAAAAIAGFVALVAYLVLS